MSKSRKLFNDSKKVIPSGVNSPVRYFDPYPFFTKKANGAYIWDEDNNRYIDFCNAYGALLLGHRRKEILNSVSKQLSKGTLYCTPTALEIELSKLILGNFPSMDKVRLMNTGGEATMTAIRLARAYTKKKKIIKFEGCYHGAHDSVLVKAGSGSAQNGISVSDGGLDEVSKNTLVVEYNNIESLQKTISKNKDIGFPIIFEPELKSILVGSTKASLDFQNLYKTKNIEITIFIDHFLIEVFINDIQSVVGIYEKFENKNQINAYSFNGSFIIEKILIWKLKKINSGYKKAKKNKIWRVKEKV